ncbi:MAG: ATP-binding protein [Rhizobacter sp.]
MTIVFVGGVHGVGKSTCCAEIAGQLDYLHIAASAVIRQERADAIASKGKLVADVPGNQELLRRGFERMKLSAGHEMILLDGHFALRDSERAIQSVPSDVFASLGIQHLICFVDTPIAIAERMNSRDGEEVQLGDVSELQAAELGTARAVALALGIQLTVLDGLDVEGLRKTLLGLR